MTGASEPAPGTLYVVGTPLGNLGDLSTRARDVLARVACVAAEDTRRTRTLLTHCGIRTTVVRYDDHTHDRVAPKLLARLAAGASVAQVSDAGMPGLSDPGVRLVNAAREAGFPVAVVPGPDAVSTALVASGLPTVPHTFHGFAPRKPGQRNTLLRALAPGTHVFYESPERTPALCAALAAAWPTSDVAVCRELTKRYESVIRGTAAVVADRVRAGVRGEVVVVVHRPASADAPVSDAALRRAVAEQRAAGIDKKTAVKAVAAEFGVPKRRVYALTVADPA